MKKQRGFRQKLDKKQRSKLSRMHNKLRIKS